MQTVSGLSVLQSPHKDTRCSLLLPYVKNVVIYKKSLIMVWKPRTEISYQEIKQVCSLKPVIWGWPEVSFQKD